MLKIPSRIVEYETSATKNEMTVIIDNEIGASLATKKKRLSGKISGNFEYKIVEKTMLDILPFFFSFMCLRVCLVDSNENSDKTNISLQLSGGPRFQLNFGILCVLFFLYVILSVFFMGFSDTYLFALFLAVAAVVLFIARFASGYSLEYNFLDVLKENNVRFKKIIS